jgi:hypothetical protein
VCNSILISKECGETSGCEWIQGGGGSSSCVNAQTCAGHSGNGWYAESSCTSFRGDDYNCLWNNTRKVCSVDSSVFCSELDSNPTDCNDSEYCIYVETSCISFGSATCGDLSGAANKNKCEKRGGCFYTKSNGCENIFECTTFGTNVEQCNSKEQCINNIDNSDNCQHISTLSCEKLINNKGNFCEKRSDCFFIGNCKDKSSITCSNFENDKDGCLYNGFIKCANYTVFFFSRFSLFFFFLI